MSLDFEMTTARWDSLFEAAGIDPDGEDFVGVAFMPGPVIVNSPKHPEDVGRPILLIGERHFEDWQRYAKERWGQNPAERPESLK